MLLPTILICIILIAFLSTWKRLLTNKKRKEKLRSLLPAITNAVREYENLTGYSVYFSNYQEKQYLQAHFDTYQAIPTRYHKFGLDNALIATFLNQYENVTTARNQYNDLFVKAEAEKYVDLFNNLEAYPLSPDQVEAVIKDEDNNLVIAGAGTGKTTTISAKVAYLLTKGLLEARKHNQIVEIN